MSDPSQPFAPPPPEGYGAPAPRGEKPAAVRMAVNLIWATIAVMVLSSIATFVAIDTIVDSTLDANATPGLSADMVRTAAIVGSVIWLVLVAGISVLLAVFIGKGHNWARVTYTILGGLGIVLNLVGLAGPGNTVITLILALLFVVLIGAIIFLLWKKESTAWLTAPRNS